MKKVLLSMLVMLSGTSAWAQTFTTDGETLTITTSGDMTSAEVAAKVAAQVLSENPSSVVVDGGGVIGDDFVHAILYPNNSANTALEDLDMQGVTLANWTVGTFRNGATDTWVFYQLGLKNLTLPLVKANAEGEVVIPSDAFAPVGSYGSFPFTSIVIPEGYTEVSAYAFNGQDKVQNVSLPKSLKVVGDMAFANLNSCDVITLNEGLEFVGNSAFALTTAKTNKTLEVPASVKYMGPGAFLCRRYQEVYFRGLEAPMCPIGKALINPYGNVEGTFGTETLMGNAGFTPNSGVLADDAQNGMANRENYKNKDVYFCIMHYPNNLTEEQEAKYTDITKKYETWEGNEWTTSGFHYGSNKVVGKETGKLSFNNIYYTNDAKVSPGYKDTYLGEQYIWPSQSQWERSYITASNGLCWDGVTEYKPTLTDEQIALLRKAGYSEAEYSVDDLSKIAFMGTRQFVLGNGDVKSQDHDYPLNVKGGKWYTFCVPFNMTKKMVDEAMGENTQVCRFSSVERRFDLGTYNHITLLFRHDVYRHKTEKVDGVYQEFNANAAPAADDDIVIYAHEAYMVKPTKTDDDPKSFVVAAYEAEVGSPVPTYVKAKNRTFEQGQEILVDDDDDTEYRFVGNYLNNARIKTKLPVNTYYFGRMKPEDQGRFWFNTKENRVNWNANSCVVETKDFETGVEDAENFFNVAAGQSSSAKQTSLFGEDDSEKETTGVTTVTIEAGEASDAIVYTLNGQIVSRNGETSNLPKGVYIMNGKKFIVK